MQNRVIRTNHNFTLLAESSTLSFRGTWMLHEDITGRNERNASNFDFLVHLNNHNYLLHPEDHAVMKELIADLRPGHQVHLRMRVISPAGNVNELEASGSFSRQGHGQGDHVRTAERNQTLINAILDNTASNIMALKPVYDNAGAIADFEYVFTNKQALRSVGRESLAGKTFLGEFPAIKTNTDLFERYCAVIETGEPWEGTVYINFDGTQDTWARVHAVAWEECCLVDYIDITPEKTSEQEIIRLKEEIARHVTDKYLTLFNSIDEGIAVLEAERNEQGELVDFRFRETNPAYQKHTGLVNVAGKTVREAVPGVEASWITLLKDVVRTGEPVRIENYSQTVDRWFNACFARIGNTDSLAVVFDDITDRKRTEQSLRESEEKLSRLLSLLPAAVYTCDLQGRITFYNNRAAQLWGREPQLMNDDEKFCGSLRLWMPDGSPLKHADCPMAEALRAGKAERNAEVILEQPSGDRMVISVSIDPLHDSAGNLTGTINVFTDITLQKRAEQAKQLLQEAEERYRTQLEKEVVERTKEILRMQEILAQQAKDKYQQLFNSIDQGFCIIELMFDEHGRSYDYRFLETNPAFEKQTGLRDAVGKTMRELEPLHEKYWFDIYGEVTQQQLPVRFIQQASFLDNRWYDVYAFPTGEQNRHQVAVLFLDITKRKRTELDLKKLNAELKELDEAKTAFFSNISHEFRTPITLLLGPLDDVIKGSASLLPRQQTEKLLLAQRNALRLQKLVNTLLDFSRFEAGQADAIYQPTDLVRFTTDLAGNFRSAIEEAGLRFVVKSDEVNEPIYVNRDMYEKVVLNLLSNAFKFTFKGKIEIRIRNKKKKVELRVSDTGEGIPSQHHAAIFERFHRITGTRSRTFEGTGIGLALVKEMVSLHQGNIAVKSSPGEGSEFIVTLLKGKDHLEAHKIHETREQLTPLQLYPHLEEMKGWMQEPESKRNTESFSLKPTVLLADDNADMRSYLSIVLQPRFQVVKAENGKKAWDIIRSGFTPDVVLADVMMPEMNGLELLEYIKRDEKYQRIPVILVSARADEASRIEGMNSGADDYLVKPFGARELVARVEARVQIARQREQTEGQLAVTNELLEDIVRKRTSELKKNNEILERKNHELEALYDELTNLTFVASHDLREPLRKLSLFADVMMREEHNNLSESGKDHLQKIGSFVRRMNDLINDMSEYSDFSAVPVRVVTNSMNQLVHSVRSSLRKNADHTDVSIETELHDRVTCDPGQMKQLLNNLLSNAIKFRKTDQPLTIGVTGRLVPGDQVNHPLADKSTVYYKLEVTDNGIGFEQKFEARIFHMFRKLHHAIDYPGTGIGLTICRKIVEHHKGFIVAKSSEGNGSSFCAYFPQ